MSSKKKNAMRRGTAQHQKYIDKLEQQEDASFQKGLFQGGIDTEQLYLYALATEFGFGPKRFEKLDEAVRAARLKWSNEIVKDFNSQTGKNKGIEKEQDDFDKILFKHLKPEMQIPWSERWAYDDKTGLPKRETYGICVGLTVQETWALGKNKEYRVMIGLDEGEDQND